VRSPLIPTLHDAARRVAPCAGWALLLWVILFYRLGYPSFWDPDEAHYAEATREMMASGDWLAPSYNGQPFFDKPVLFYWLQTAAFGLLGPTELAARMVPAVSALGLFAGVWWLGAQLFNRRVAALAVLMLAILPATFALSAYAILDMTFTAFLFDGLALIAVAALRNRPRLQYPGYLLIALAVLTKGPLALALSGLTFGLALMVAPAARRPLLGLRWITGLCGILVLSAPWFLYMWWRFGGAFVEGYVLHENVSLYSGAVFGPAASTTFFWPILIAGLLPWTPVLMGRIIDLLRGDGFPTEERVLWAWSAAILGFFSISHFKLDHYIYPMAPALCLLAAQAWHQLCGASSRRAHLGTAAGVGLTGVALIAGAAALAPQVRNLPFSMEPWINLVPLGFALSGAWVLVRLAFNRWRPPGMPIAIASSFVVAYGVLLMVVLPQLEEAKPVKELARWVADTVPSTEEVGAYRMDRWNTSWRFYVERPVVQMESFDQLSEFVRRPGRRVCVMMRADFERLRDSGYRVSIVRERHGIFTTTGRSIRRASRANWNSFVIVAVDELQQ
jgi:4-amino-4-deoxy-L-arabinose transferase-like glycosyltransferase